MSKSQLDAVVEPKEKKTTFSEPHNMVMDNSRGYQVVDENTSEEYRLLEALGTPRVIYALKANKYFKDMSCSKEYTDAELQALELPLPIEIETARRKLIKAANDSGTLANLRDIYLKTSPSEIKLPREIRDRLAVVDPIERMVRKLEKTIK